MKTVDRTQPGAAEDQQLAELVEEIAELLQLGASGDVDEYIARYPEYADRLRDWVNAMSAMADLGHSLIGGDQSRGESDVRGPVTGVLGDFRILRELGRGGMGVVYEAEQISLGRCVALKVLPFAAMLDKQQLARFKNEARAAATLDHPNIVAIFSVGAERGVHYYAMQLVEGQSLAQIIEVKREKTGACGPSLGAKTVAFPATDRRQRTMDSVVDTQPVASLSTLPDSDSREYFRSVARLGVQAAEALEHAHQNGILHRDVKPANLMVDDDGKLWVTDFGLARIEQDAGMTMTGDILGTLRYMSPEQALAKRVVVDHRSDVYSLGVTLYELATLRAAYPATDRHELLRQIAFDEPLKPRQQDEHIPRDLETIVLKAMEKNPSQRYGTARDLADDLRNFLAHQPIKAKPPNWADHLVKWSRRHPVAIRTSALAFLATVLVLAGSVGWISRDRAARQSMLAQQINLALDEARKSYDAGRPAEAMSAVKRASGILASGGGSREFDEPIARWQRDLNTVQRLEQIQSSWDDTADRAYRDVFRGYCVDLESLDMEKAARTVRTSPIRRDLIAALHDWLAQHESDGSLPTLESPRNKQLLQIANLADPDPWRTRFRDAIQRSDTAALNKFAHDPATIDQPPTTILLLVGAINSWRGVFRSNLAASLLEDAQRRHPNDYWINYLLGVRLNNSKGAEKAITYLRIAVALRPDSKPAYEALASALVTHGDLEEAVSALREGIRLAPDDPSCYYQLEYVLRNLDKDAEADAIARQTPPIGSAQSTATWHSALTAAMASGNLDRAEKLAHEHVRIAPARANARGDLAVILLNRRKFKEAEAACREEIRLGPDNYFAYARLGAILHRQRKYAEAEAVYREAIPRAPSNPEPYLELGTELEWQGKYDEAESAFRECLRLHDYADPHWGLGNVFMKRADALGENPPWDAAAQEFALAIDGLPDDSSSSSGRKFVCFELSKWNEVFERVVGLRPTEPCLWIGRAQRHVFQSKWDAAAADYARVIHTRPIHEELFEYAYILVLQDDLIAYQRFCKEVITRAGEPKDAGQANILACACTAAPCDAVDPAQIIEWAKMAAGRGNTSGWNVNSLGMAYLRAGQYAKAIKWFESSNRYAWARDAQLGRNWFGMAIAHERLGHEEESRRCLETGQELTEQARPLLDEPIKLLKPVDWLALHVLGREAEDLIESSTDANASQTTKQPNEPQHPNPKP